MARTYAGIMALVGMTVVLIRALKQGAALEGSVLVALSWMAALGVVGLVVGAIAQATIDEAVRLHMETELEVSDSKLAVTTSPQSPMRR